MSEQFVAEIRMFPFNFAPTGWAFCHGQLMPLSQNTALFSLLGTTYGGNGKSNFALPNLQDAVPMQPGQGPGLSLHDLGEQGGQETVTLLTTEIPSHGHTANAHAGVANSNDAAGKAVARPFGGGLLFTNTASAAPMSDSGLAVAGGSVPHNNLMPTLVVNFCIALQGIFPPRG